MAELDVVDQILVKGLFKDPTRGSFWDPSKLTPATGPGLVDAQLSSKILVKSRSRSLPWHGRSDPRRRIVQGSPMRIVRRSFGAAELTPMSDPPRHGRPAAEFEDRRRKIVQGSLRWRVQGTSVHGRVPRFQDPRRRIVQGSNRISSAH